GCAMTGSTGNASYQPGTVASGAVCRQMDCGGRGDAAAEIVSISFMRAFRTLRPAPALVNGGMSNNDRVTDPDLHLLADGRRFAPNWQGSVACFSLPAMASGVRLRSLATQPCALGDSGDTRHLGYGVTSITVVHAGGSRRFAPSDLHLLDGFHSGQPGVDCWTNGDAHLPDAWFSG